MTSISLHPMPARDTVAREQVSAVGVALRKAGLIFVSVLAVLGILPVVAAVRAAQYPNNHMGFSYGIGAAIPIALVGLFVPFTVWRREDPSRRSYHWAMPIARVPHTLMKVLAGWLWLMAAVVVYLVFMIAIGWLMSVITGSTFHREWTGAWEWAVPFTAATVAYLLSTVAVLASDHPWGWIGGIGIGYLMVIVFLHALNMNDAARALTSVTDGYYGLGAAMFAKLETSRYGGPASASRWIGSALIWGALGAAGVVIAAYRRPG
ncbi:MAG: hypothetical protein ACR2M1_07390 [Gemmatimonadaceae bacterium]